MRRVGSPPSTNRPHGRSAGHRRALASAETGERAEAGREMFPMVAAEVARFGEPATLRSLGVPSGWDIRRRGRTHTFLQEEETR